MFFLVLKLAGIACSKIRLTSVIFKKCVYTGLHCTKTVIRILKLKCLEEVAFHFLHSL